MVQGAARGILPVYRCHYCARRVCQVRFGERVSHFLSGHIEWVERH